MMAQNNRILTIEEIRAAVIPVAQPPVRKRLSRSPCGE
jgi:hypothetical protein